MEQHDADRVEDVEFETIGHGLARALLIRVGRFRVRRQDAHVGDFLGVGPGQRGGTLGVARRAVRAIGFGVPWGHLDPGGKAGTGVEE